MNATGSLPDGFTWQGSLDETDIRSLYAACHSLRFSGRLHLKDGAQAAEVVFVAGEPIEIDGGDTQRIALWARGTFRAEQAIPSLNGELTSSREISGSLGTTKPSALWAWISEYRLTCEIELERPGGKAIVTFQNGHAEQASVNGLPELAALARVSSWTDGIFKVRLRPLFIDGVIPVAPPMPESAPPAGPQQFDVSRSIPMDLRNKSSPPPLPQTVTFNAKPPTPTPPRGEVAHGNGEIGRPEGENTSKSPKVLPYLADPSAPKKKSSAGLITILLLLIVLAGGAGAAYYFHLPPFSPPPRPLIDAPPKPEEVSNSGTTTKDEKSAEANSGTTTKDEKSAEANSGTTTKDEKSAEANSGTTTKDEKSAEANSGTTTKDEKSAEENTAGDETGNEKVDEKKDRANKERAEKLVMKGRMLLAEGHEHTALDLFRKAEKLQPNNAAYRVFEQQALGKLGRAELWIEGKGTVVVDGHRFAAPRKVKIAAGPHTIDSADGEGEVTLKRGEKKKLRGKKG